jgi:hypothetical protein
MAIQSQKPSSIHSYPNRVKKPFYKPKMHLALSIAIHNCNISESFYYSLQQLLWQHKIVIIDFKVLKNKLFDIQEVDLVDLGNLHKNSFEEFLYFKKLIGISNMSTIDFV